jgi:hypothetical protein
MPERTRVWPEGWIESLERGLAFNRYLPWIMPYPKGFWEARLPSQEPTGVVDATRVSWGERVHLSLPAGRWVIMGGDGPLCEITVDRPTAVEMRQRAHASEEGAHGGETSEPHG